MNKYLRITNLYAFLLCVSCSFAYSQPSAKILLRGFVHDGSTNEGMQGASIFIDGKPSTTTDARGYFEVAVSLQMHKVRATYVGYDPVEKTIEPNADESTVNVFFVLKQVAIEQDSVIVMGVETSSQRLGAPVVSLSIAEMASIPRFAEPDPIRIMQTLPGVTSSDFDYIAQLNLRGGSFDETLIALDGVPLYNPYHFGGWFSMLSADILKREDLFRSNYPLNMSGYLSGALSMVSKDGSAERHKGSASLGVSSASVLAEGPFGGGTYVVSARRIWLDMIANLIKNNMMPYYFYDVYGKYTIPVDENNLLKLSVFYSRDVLDPIQSYNLRNFNINDYPHWSNKLIRGSWNIFLASGASAEFSLYESQSLVRGDVNADYEYEGKKYLVFDNGITERAVKLDLHLTTEGSRTAIGGEVKEFQLIYSWDVQWDRFGDPVGLFFPRPSTFFDYAENTFDYGAYTKTFGVYASHSLKVDEIDLTIGYRLNYLGNIKALMHSPFASATVALGPSMKFTAAYGKYYQQLYAMKEAKREIVFSAPYAVRFLAGSGDEVAQSDHFSAGIHVAELPLDGSLDIEAYYKKRDNLPSSYFDTTAHYVFEDGYATGVDILFKMNQEPLNGWVGYSLARSVKNGHDYDYFSNVDRTHSLKIVIGHKIFEWLKVDAFWTYASGVPYTDVVGKYVGAPLRAWYPGIFASDPEWRPIEGRKNSGRTIPYHRLDVGLTGYFVWGGVMVKPYLQVFNAYNAANPFLFDFKRNPSSSDQRGSFIMPTFGVTADF